MGINPKIGITGLPRSGKSAVLQKVVDMITEEGSGFRRTRGPSPPEHVVGGMRCEPVIENGERVGSLRQYPHGRERSYGSQGD